MLQLSNVTLGHFGPVQDAQVCARFNGGANAGHTLIVDARAARQAEEVQEQCQGSASEFEICIYIYIYLSVGSCRLTYRQFHC